MDRLLSLAGAIVFGVSLVATASAQDVAAAATTLQPLMRVESIEISNADVSQAITITVRTRASTTGWTKPELVSPQEKSSATLELIAAAVPPSGNQPPIITGVAASRVIPADQATFDTVRVWSKTNCMEMKKGQAKATECTGGSMPPLPK